MNKLETGLANAQGALEVAWSRSLLRIALWKKRSLGTEKEWTRIIVFTCRPDDYLPQAARVPGGKEAYADMNGGLIRAVDSRRALHRRQGPYLLSNNLRRLPAARQRQASLHNGFASYLERDCDEEVSKLLRDHERDGGPKPDFRLAPTRFRSTSLERCSQRTIRMHPVWPL